jgi:hypothetical protein
MMALIVAASPCAAKQLSFPTVPAYWSEEANDLAPTAGDFSFESLSFADATHGWIVGDRYMLHIDGDRLELQFLRSSDVCISDIDATDAAQLVAAGFVPRRPGGKTVGVVLRREGPSWRVDELQTPEDPEWTVDHVRVSADAAWALGTAIPTAGGPTSLLWRRDGDQWRIDAPHLVPPGRVWSFARMCLDPVRNGWLVGTEWTPERMRRPLVVRVGGAQLERAVLPDLPGPNAYVTQIACTGEGGAIAAAVVNASGAALTDAGGTPMLLAYDGAWQTVALPSQYDGYHVSALAALSATDVWLALSALDRGAPTFVHWHDGAWDTVAPPALPDGRTTGYDVSAMQFVSPSQGWAVANDYAGPGIVRGLIFQFRDGVWRNRNWNWHFWDQRWFGLFGD